MPLDSAELSDYILHVVPSAGLMLCPVRKMPIYFSETHRNILSCYNKSNLINGALSIFVLQAWKSHGLEQIKQYTKAL
jgi:hypothetical protein